MDIRYVVACLISSHNGLDERIDGTGIDEDYGHHEFAVDELIAKAIFRHADKWDFDLDASKDDILSEVLDGCTKLGLEYPKLFVKHLGDELLDIQKCYNEMMAKMSKEEFVEKYAVFDVYFSMRTYLGEEKWNEVYAPEIGYLKCLKEDNIDIGFCFEKE